MKMFRFLLFPFGVLYFLVTYIRNKFYDFNIFKSTSFNVPLIGIGNLSSGGTGKTPMVEYLIRKFSDKHNTVLISRGYKRSTNGYVRAFSSSSPESIGDEPFQIFKKFNKINVVVDSNRVRGVSKILSEEPKTDLIVLDDCFQHRKINLKLNIVLTTYHSPFYNDFIIPVGNLREQRNSYKRADVIIVTKCPELISNDDLDHFRKKIQLHNNQNIFFTKINYDNNLKGDSKINLDLILDPIILVTGIANSDPIVDFLKNSRVVFEHISYSDHFNYSQNDIDKKEKNSNKLIITTENESIFNSLIDKAINTS
jgi:tetraacyldisaccharide 4'-kinase